MRPGEIYRHRRFYLDAETGEFKDKYFLVLAILPGGDLVVRLLTSRPHGRPEHPPCYHGDPYPGFFLGTPGAPLSRPTWLDLRALEDFDPAQATRRSSPADITHALTLRTDLFRQALDCAAAANDTTRLQERALRDQMAALEED